MDGGGGFLIGYAGGKTCAFSGNATLQEDGYLRARFGVAGSQASCPDFRADFFLRANGQRLEGATVTIPCGNIRVVATK